MNDIEHAEFALCGTRGVQELLNNSRNFGVLFLRCHNGLIEQRMYLRVRKDSIITGREQWQDVLVLLQEQGQ